MRIKYLIVLIIFNIISGGCSLSREELINNETNEIYTFFHKESQNKNLKQAIIQLESINDRHPFSPYSQQVQLDLIYLYYKHADLQAAQTIINRFMRLNPIHPNIDYVIYMRGLIKMTLDDNKIQDFFKIDRSSIDPQYALDAFNDFSKIIYDYPNSKYVSRATKHLVFLKNRLAKYEFLIADYYMQHGAWIAVINRIKGILYNYPNAQVTYDGLKLMEKAYRQMQMNIQADRIKRILTLSESKDFNLSQKE